MNKQSAILYPELKQAELTKIENFNCGLLILFQNSGAMAGDLFGSAYFSFNKTMDLSAFLSIMIVAGYLTIWNNFLGI